MQLLFGEGSFALMPRRLRRAGLRGGAAGPPHPRLRGGLALVAPPDGRPCLPDRRGYGDSNSPAAHSIFPSLPKVQFLVSPFIVLVFLGVVHGMHD